MLYTRARFILQEIQYFIQGKLQIDVPSGLSVFIGLKLCYRQSLPIKNDTAFNVD